MDQRFEFLAAEGIDESWASFDVAMNLLRKQCSVIHGSVTVPRTAGRTVARAESLSREYVLFATTGGRKG